MDGYAGADFQQGEMGDSGQSATSAQPSAQPAAAAQPPVPAQPQTAAQPPATAQSQTAAQPEKNDWINPALKNAAAQPPATAPTAPVAPVVTSKKPGGIIGLIDSLADTLYGRTRPEYGEDAQGNPYVKQHVIGRGEQWFRIASGMAAGALAGGEAGRGGHPGAAFAAGAKVGQQRNQQRSQQEQQVWLEVANAQKLKHETVANALTLANLQRQGEEHDIEFSQKQADRLTGQGETLVGHIESLQDLTKFMRETPNFNQDQVGKDGVPTTGAYTPVATYDANGKANGFDLYRKNPGSDDEMQPAGTLIAWFNPIDDEIEYRKTSLPMKTADVNATWMVAGNAKQGYDLKKSEIEEHNSVAEKNRNPQPNTETPSETRLHTAETAKAWAEAHKAQADADGRAADSEELQGRLIDQIGRGQMPVGRLSYLLARNPKLMEAVSKKYPDFDGGNIDAYVAANKEFKSGRIGDQINSGGTVLEHLNQLRMLNTNASHIPGTPDYNAYQNQLNTLAPELTKFYGDQNIPASQRVLSTLGSTLPGTRDAAIAQQARSMTVKFQSFKQQWKNAAPSPAYNAQMPWISPEGQKAWAELDKVYNPKPAPSVQGQGTYTQIYENKTTGQKIGLNAQNQWVDIQTGQAVK